jgi:hypothetical protein
MCTEKRLKQLTASFLAVGLMLLPLPSPRDASAATTPTVSLDFDGMSFGDSGNSIPPDTHVAVGPSHIVEVINHTIAVYSKTSGVKLMEQDLPTFFDNTLPNGPGGFDPSVTYDELAGRFIVIMLQVTSSDEGFLWYGVSNTSNPLDGFTEIHSIRLDGPGINSTQTVEPDFPRIGWNADAHVIAMSMNFAAAADECDHVTLIIIDKSTVLDANNSTFTFHQVNRSAAACGADPGIVPTIVPAIMHGAAHSGPMYLLEETNQIGNDPTVVKSQVRVTKMTNVLSATPTFSSTDIAVNNYSVPPDADQPNGSGTIQTNDARFLSVAWRGNRLLAAHNVGLPAGAPTQALARWYQFDTSNTTPALMQQGTINPGAGVSTYYPSIEIAANGDIGMTFMQSSASEHMSMYITGRTSSDAAGTMAQGTLVKAGEATYKANDCFSGGSFTQDCLTGDFSGIAVDPSANNAFCAANEYATSSRSTENWGTHIACFTLGSSPVPTPPPSGHDLAVTGLKVPKSVKNGGGTLPVSVKIQNLSGHPETINDLSVFGDGVGTGLVTLDVEEVDNGGEGCHAAVVALNNAKNGGLFSKGPKTIKTNGTLTVNFLVTYLCDSPLPKNQLTPDPGDYSHVATVHADALDGTPDSNTGNDSFGPVMTNVVP